MLGVGNWELLPACVIMGLPEISLLAHRRHLSKSIVSTYRILQNMLWVALGAALGANTRYWLGVWLGHRLGLAFPYGTFLVNVTGSFLLAFLLALTTEQFPLSRELRLLLVVGFLGSYTTFSSLAVESLNLWRHSGALSALANVLGNNLLGLLAALMGLLLAQGISR